MNTQKTGTVSEELYQRLLNQNEELERKLHSYQEKSPLVGIRWYGEGICRIGLSVPINGLKRVDLDGFNSTCVADYNTWVRLSKSHIAKEGVLVRDDSVVDELSVTGKLAIPDKVKNPNAFTEKEILDALNGTLKNLEKTLNIPNSHFTINAFRLFAKQIDLKDRAKRALITQRYNELFTHYRWSRCHRYDLKAAGEEQNIVGWQDMSDEQLARELANREIELEKSAEGDDF